MPLKTAGEAARIVRVRGLGQRMDLHELFDQITGSDDCLHMIMTSPQAPAFHGVDPSLATGFLLMMVGIQIGLEMAAGASEEKPNVS